VRVPTPVCRLLCACADSNLEIPDCRASWLTLWQTNPKILWILSATNAKSFAFEVLCACADPVCHGLWLPLILDCLRYLFLSPHLDTTNFLRSSAQSSSLSRLSSATAMRIKLSLPTSIPAATLLWTERLSSYSFLIIPFLQFRITNTQSNRHNIRVDNKSVSQSSVEVYLSTDWLIWLISNLFNWLTWLIWLISGW
jgi:hypothetical protein